MNQQFTPPLTRFNLKLILMAFTWLLLINSCKKELYTGEKLDPALVKLNKSYHQNPKIKTVTFNAFKSTVNISALGTLKNSLATAKINANKTISVSTEETFLGFALNTESIKKIVDSAHTSYVFSVKSSSQKAITFQNLTIDESASGTIAFVTTYTPTKKWIADWKGGYPGKFEGTIDINFLDLKNGTPLPAGITSGSSNKSVKNGQPTTASLVYECVMVDFYYYDPFACASGTHMPGDDGCELEGEFRAGYTERINPELSCYFRETGNPNPPGGGGVGTTPNPPPDYDPCDRTQPPPVYVSGKKSLGSKILFVPPTECDSSEIPPVEIINNVQDPCLKNTVALTLNNDVTGAIKDIIKKLDKDITVSIKIFDAATTTNGGSGETTRSLWSKDPITGNVLSFSTNITLSKDILLTSSREFTTSVIIHEILHAYFRETTGKQEEFNGLDHQTIATNYISPMATFLSGLYGIGIGDAMALSWDGLEGTKAFKENDSFTIGSGSNATTLSKQDVKDTIRDYILKSNGKGKNLCQ